jgi:murein DD-endopeptidase MepM/ murein hydrolase activator NlpD
LLNASVDVQRVIGRLRRPQKHHRRPNAGTLQIRSIAAVRRVQGGFDSLVVASRLAPVRETSVVVERPADAPRRPLLWRLGHDRAVAVAVAGILVSASLVSLSGGRTTAATGGTSGPGTEPRIAVGGGVDDRTGGTDPFTEEGLVGSVEFGEPDQTLTPEGDFSEIDFGDGATESEPVDVKGPFIDDGTLVKPVAVDTTVPDGRDLVRTYTVREGDTLVGIASKFKVSMMSVWWANDLESKEVKAGKTLRIPPVTGLIVTVAATDTLDGLAAKYKVNSTDILATNGLDDRNLVVGQVLVVAGAKGKAMPKPTSKPTSKPASRNTTTRPSNGGDGNGGIRPPSTYEGGKFTWPVVGGDNYVSQYYHYGHLALDIAADHGSTVRAAAPGIVVFAGWKSNGGGYQVWIAHGSGLFTTYNHMSAISVGRGEHVGRGDHVGRVGQSGNASGPHLHFEVWKGPVWDGGRRVNPLGYL